MKGGTVVKVVVIGGGAAGMVAAIMASRKGHQVIIVEKMRSLGRKLSITGKGRCNITNATEMENFIKKNDGNALMDFINEVEVLCDPETTFQITEEGKEFLKELENENLKSD